MASSKKTTRPYEVLDHTADLRIRVRASDLPSLFENAGHALFDIIADVNTVQPARRRRLSIQGADLEELMVNWLSELHYHFEVHGLLLRRFSVLSLDDRSLRAQVQGEAYDPDRHRLKTDIKAVTYHQLEIAQVGGEWQAAIVFDI